LFLSEFTTRQEAQQKKNKQTSPKLNLTLFFRDINLSREGHGDYRMTKYKEITTKVNPL